MSYLTKIIFDEYKDKLNTNTDYQKIDTYIWQGISMLPRIERKVIVSKYYPRFHGVPYLSDKAIGMILRLWKGDAERILSRAVWKVKQHIKKSNENGEI